VAITLKWITVIIVRLRCLLPVGPFPFAKAVPPVPTRSPFPVGVVYGMDMTGPPRDYA